MTLPVISPRNQLQAAPAESAKIGRVTNAATGLYTVPAGKLALVTAITGNLDAVGADATTAVAIKRGATVFPIGAHVAVNGISTWFGSMVLEATDIITNVGDAGATNSTMDMSASVKEYDA